MPIRPSNRYHIDSYKSCNLAYIRSPNYITFRACDTAESQTHRSLLHSRKPPRTLIVTLTPQLPAMITKLAPTPRTRHMQTALRLLDHVLTPRTLFPLLLLRQPQHPLRIFVLRANRPGVFPRLAMHARARLAFRARGDVAFDRGRRDEHATSLCRAIHGIGRVHFEKHQMVLFDEGRV